MLNSRNKKNLLVVFSSDLVPITMMNQNRTIYMIKRLAIDHKVDLLTSDTNDHELLKMTLPEIENIYYFKNHKNFHWLRKLFFYMTTFILIRVFLFPEHYITIINLSFKRKLKQIVEKNDYNFLLLHYWYLIKMLASIKEIPTVILDTHGLIYEKILLESNDYTGFLTQKIESFYARKYKKEELKSLNHANLLIFNSKKDRSIYIDELNGKVDSITISNGQDLNYFNNKNEVKAKNTILFYGSLGGLQSQIAFKKFWFDIFPLILEEKKEVRLIVLGNNPPKWVLELKSDSIIITGFVEDIRPYLKESNVCILPLTHGAGFRGRVIELMAMGVPVVGTHNALDCVNMTHGKHGYITDNNLEMAMYVIQILEDEKLNRELSFNCVSFIRDNFSIEDTYGRLSNYLISYKNV